MPDDQYRGNGTERRLSKMETDLYYGNGKPGITTRLATLEDHMNDSKDRLKSIDNKFWAMISLLLATLVGVIVNIVVKR